MMRYRGRGRRRVYARRSRRLASSGMKLRSGRTVGPPRGSGFLATGARVAGAAARGARWLTRSELGKRVASAAAGYYNAKKNRTGRSSIKNKLELQDAGASAQYSKSVVKFGKYRSVDHALKKLDKRNVRSFIMRFGKSERFTDYAGGFGLYNQVDPVTPTTYSLPIHVFDVTSSNLRASATGYTSVNVPAMRYAKIQSNGIVSFDTYSGRANDGTNTTNYFDTIKATAQSFGNFSTTSPENAVLEYVNAKFLFRCPTDRPGWIKITLLQITDEDILPGATTTAHTAFWYRRAKALMFNPISHEVSGQTAKGDWNGCKVLKTIIRRFNPDTTTNKATYNGEQIRVDLFARLNRYVNFRDREGQYLMNNTTVGGLDDDAYIEEGKQGAPGTTNESNPRVWNTASDFKGRVFMVVEGTFFDTPIPAATVPGDGSDINKKGIQYDAEIRTKWICQQA